MTSDLALAFAHPEARARATETEPIADRISLRDHIVEVEIGAFQQERGRTQRICFNVVVEVAQEGDLADDVDRILSYDRITEAIAAELSGDRLNLLETLAERVAARVLAEPQARRIFVRIEKLDLGPGALGVEIVRSREDLEPAPVAETMAHPVVIFLSREAALSPRLSAWLDDIEAHRRPAILCVGATGLPLPEAAHPAPQRRIDLLAIEQAAWVLAARDRRCVVVESRTELDWAAKQGRISVWAPSKMVLDAADPPESIAPEALAAWLAGEMGASDLAFVGAAAPEGCGARRLDVSAGALTLAE
ncbi:dihydroneopterin aldolase [Ovoidimarina sediminis]|uniref:dihydroneopterin aldolase n=1 Tax=Ovoidimarina sediminis TaxID=3079856 RepID=UPI0029099FFA|nr:dihydroneopterin aldolase [Rhodophyticola sp. MJ-SS7]MDU8943860.1 dihydroneopterin aldolase [Rhodophyticola sp. MJ-SS7]